MILELLRDAFPHITSLPSSAHQTKKLTNDLGLGYKKIHACPNDCMLYWDKSEVEQSCHTCKASRYRSDGDQLGESSNSRKSKKPAKVLRYFPLISRLKRLYKCETTTKDMRWHDMGRTKDGKLRHPGDGLAWKAFNDRYPKFASDPRSVRLDLASDGCNPFRMMKSLRRLKIQESWPLVHIDIQLKDDPFIVSSQAKQVFYIEDVKDVGWLHVNMNYPRDTCCKSYLQVLFMPFKLLFLLFPDHLKQEFTATWKMFRSKATMEQHAKKYTQNKNNSTRMESHMQPI
ncbi:zinc finger, CCHC-type containing protein, partial [Tanacetum coccineum]